LVVPIGAFVEPDETEMRKASLRTRLRVFSVGPSSNLVLALVCAAVFSMGMVGSLQPVSDGAYIAAVVEGSPADIAGLRPSTLITAVQLEGQAQPQHMTDYRDLSVVLANSTPHSNITLHYLTARGVGTVTFELGDWPAERIPPGEVRTRGWVGVSLEDPERYLAYARPGARIVDGCQELPATPGNGCAADSVAGYLALPMQGLSPLPAERQWLYEPTGPWAALGGAFWTVADAFYWLFWLNLMVGAFNVLPMLPLDGGHMFRDGVHSLLRRFSRKPGITVEQEMGAPATVAASARGAMGQGPRSEDDDFLGVSADRRPVDEVFGPTRDPLERRAHTITVYTSFLMLGLIIWQVIGSYVGNALGA
jgi:membrane-associated protease RseP (regulator of RpoE activity)